MTMRNIRKTVGIRRLGCILAAASLFAASAHATLVSTDPVTGGRTYRFTPDDADFATFSTTWNINSTGYFRDGDVFEFEESEQPYVFTRYMWIQRHPYLVFRGVKSDGSDADKSKVVFTYGTEGTTSFFQMEAASNLFANITFTGMALDFRTSGNIVSNCVFSSIADRSAIYGNTTAAEVAVHDSFFTNNVHSSGYAVIRNLKVFAATNCIFHGNVNADTSINGGGAIAGVSKLSCENCAFTENRTTGWYGGAIFQNGGEIALDHCSFVGNSETVTYNRNDGCGGGAVAVISSAIGHIRNCLFASNSCATAIGKNSRSYGGGAVYTSGNSTALSIENCTFSGNFVSDISGNTGSDIGGALVVGGGSVGVTNCVFHENRTNLTDGDNGSWRFAHVYLPSAAACGRIANCLESNFGTLDFNAVNGRGRPAATHITDGVKGCLVGDYDPLFTDAANCDYTLQKKSPCRDAGATLAWMDDAALDLAGKARVVGALPDIGAYEWFSVLRPTSILLR